MACMSARPSPRPACASWQAIRQDAYEALTRKSDTF